MKKILHIAVHLGGGVGTVLRTWMRQDKENTHLVLCLNHTYGAEKHPLIIEDMRGKYRDIEEAIRVADAVIIHFWNHPYLFEFLANCTFPPCRLCFWAHMSGLNAPYIMTPSLVKMSHRFLFSSPISYEASEIKNLHPREKAKLGVIWTTGDVKDFLALEKQPHDSFNIGCVGTLDYSKLHPNFVQMCEKIRIPNAHFIVCGGGCHEQAIKEEVERRGLTSKFTFTGVVTDIKPFLSLMDVFGYPLNPTHFGTCEQVLGEAMAAGLVPVVMNNPAEEYILYKNFFKFVSTDEDEYVFNIERFYQNRHRLSALDEVKERVKFLYDPRRMVYTWDTVLDGLLLREKAPTGLNLPPHQRTGHDLFLASLGHLGETIALTGDDFLRTLFAQNLQWHSEGKGSVKQYARAFPEDKTLQHWTTLL